ncbi:hypothetical protein OG802_25805 [Streptomyces sp. NBC_00704]|uniref:hypothetical protein n=1 Tax=Streptomyces sp. NBC_00704 TaxID=2975809 RepID=UPI002E30A79E|nr:hypothetical protein [Streptomyces sp. NBC_00704]
MTEDGDERDFCFAPMTRREREDGALRVLRTARVAARLLDRRPNPDESGHAELDDQVHDLWTAVAELLPGLPDPGPLDTAHQQELIRCAGELAVLLRAYNWGDEELTPEAVDEVVRTENAGETGAADGFDALGKLILPHASPQGWAAELVTRAAEGNETLERAVKLGKYLLHPTALLILDDVTEIIGQAVYSLHVKKLIDCVNDLDAILVSGRLAELLEFPYTDGPQPGGVATVDGPGLEGEVRSVTQPGATDLAVEPLWEEPLPEWPQAPDFTKSSGHTPDGVETDLGDEYGGPDSLDGPHL